MTIIIEKKYRFGLKEKISSSSSSSSNLKRNIIIIEEKPYI
jgi:hypothetical protein